VTSRQGRRVKEALTRELVRLAPLADRSPALILASLNGLANELFALAVPEDLGPSDYYELQLRLSSLQIDSAARRRDRLALERGRDWAQQVHEADAAPSSVRTNAAFNLANALLDLHQLDLAEFREKPVTAASLRRAPFELTRRNELRLIRRLFAEVGHSEELGGLERSRALCNLGNVLDESGRWVEAYESYVDALLAFPQNGNAAGNAAELLRRRLDSMRGPGGHYAAVYNKYVALAQSLRPYTVALAGEATAQRWDALPLLDGVGHLSHDGDPLDDYQQWISKSRLALSDAIEGLGSDNPQWDDAMAKSVFVEFGEPDPPPIFAALNVIKAEFLVARRLAFEGETRLLEHQFGQDPSDTGTYADSLDYAVYGQPAAQLVLAQRAAVDVLDKVAVAANLHFKTGLDPAKVLFRAYWADGGSGILRKHLPRVDPPAAGAAIALAEMALDIDEDGLYADALALRNAGTHRLVHVNPLEPGGVSTAAQSTVGLFELVDGCRQTLQVARSAYLYLIDLIDEGEQGSGRGERLSVPLPLQT
jgi:hypothetical protein